MEKENNRFSQLKKELGKNQKLEMKILYNNELTEAYIIIKRYNPTHKLHKKELQNFVSKENISYGLIEKAIIDNIINDFNSNDKILEKKYLIAKGKKPIDTIPDNIKILASNSELVIENEVIGEVIPLIQGSYGITIHNKKIPPKINRKNIYKAGKNIDTLEKNGKILIVSKIKGVVSIDNYEHKISVLYEEDGKFELKISTLGEVLLSIYPPIGRKKSINSKMIIDKINELKIHSLINYSVMEKAIKVGVTEKIINYNIGQGKPENYQIEINISNDRMKAYINIIKPIIPKNELNTKIIIEALVKNGVIKGYSTDDILTIIEKVNFRKESLLNKLIAEGENPLDEEEDYIDYNIEFSHKNIEFTIEDKNGKEINSTGNISELIDKNTLICYLIKSTLEGKAGFRVTGEKISFKKRISIKLKAGKNIRIVSESNNKIAYYSTMSGKVYLYDDTIQLIPE